MVYNYLMTDNDKTQILNPFTVDELAELKGLLNRELEVFERALDSNHMDIAVYTKRIAPINIMLDKVDALEDEMYGIGG